MLHCWSSMQREVNSKQALNRVAKHGNMLYWSGECSLLQFAMNARGLLLSKLFFRSLGVSQLGVVINKLDTVSWSEERFKEIVSKLKSFLRQAGFKESDVTYIPCSGMTGENLVKTPTEPQLLSWYKGSTLINVIG